MTANDGATAQGADTGTSQGGSGAQDQGSSGQGGSDGQGRGSDAGNKGEVGKDSPNKDGGTKDAGTKDAGKGNEPRGEAADGKDEDGSGVAGGGKAAREAMSQAGGGTHRRENERASQHILGDQVAGDKIVNLVHGEKSVRLYGLSPALAEAVRRTFVAPVGWTDMRHHFERQRMLILRGRPGTGRTAAAVRLLQSTSVSTVYELDPNVDLGAFGELLQSERRQRNRLEADAAFILDRPVDKPRIGGFDLRGLDSSLHATGGHLVVTTGTDDQFIDDEVRRYVVDLEGPPDMTAVLEAHLRWRLDDDRRARHVMSLAGFQSLCQELLRDGSTFELAAMIAERIGWEPADEIDFVRVRKRISDRSANSFAEWFAGLPDLPTRCFAVALAVLDGLPFADVARAAAGLRDRLDTTERIVSAPDLTQVANAVDPMQTANARRLQYLQATTEEGYVRLSVGRVPVTVARYRQRTTAHQVIERAWLQYQIQDELLDWLRWLVEDSSEKVRAFAATSLGLLATLSFDRVLGQVLQPLALDTAKHRRQAAASALRDAATKDKLRPAVTALVNTWFGDSDPELQATAARAYGMILGRRDLRSSLQALGRLAAVDNINVAVAIGDAMCDLIANDPEPTSHAILPALLSWFDETKRAPTAQLAFLVVAIGVLREIEAHDDPLTVSIWPGLLYLANSHAELREPLAMLWHRVFNEGGMAEQAEGVLSNWAGRAEANGDVMDAFRRLVRAVAAQSLSTRGALLRLALDWVDPDRLKPMPRASAAVRVVLGERGDIDGRS